MLRHSYDSFWLPNARRASVRRFLCIAALPFGLAACAQLELTLPPLPEASDDPAVTEAEYPELDPTPDRPQLGYDLEQAREIEQGLLSDRVNARYTGDAIRYETGQLEEPPPLPTVLRPLPPTSGPGDLIASDASEVEAAEVALEERLAAQNDEIEDDESSLDDFLEDLGLGQADSQQPAPRESIPVVNAPVEEEPSETVAALAPSDSQPLTVDFAPGAAVLPTGSIVDLTELAARLSLEDVGARIVAGGSDTGLAIDRARAVAVRLVARGVPGDQIDVETGGPEDQVVIYPRGGES